MSEKAEAARLIAKLLANRRTSLDEIPVLIESVQRALAGLGAVAKEIPIIAAPAPKQRPARAKRTVTRAQSSPIPAPPEPAPKALPSMLVRRSTVISVAPAAPMAIFAPAPGSAVRGVVQWFDSRTGQGTLRLAGLSRDVPVDAAMLAAFGIPRLFKGQEIEATLEGAGETPKVVALHLANAPATKAVSGGTVLDRRAKPVVVELKREAQRRGAARAEAELLLPPQRAR
jgi:cold shock CspA family protein